MNATAIDTDRFSVRLRERGLDLKARKVLITNLLGSEQAKDLSEPANCDGFGRIRHFHRATADGWPENPLPIDPARAGLRASSDSQLLRAQVFQNAVCNWRCWYCYVDFPLLSGNAEHSAMLSADELLELYESVPEPPRVIDLSGGQPDIVPEWIVWMAQALQRRGLGRSIYLWSDDNLSNDYFWTKLSDAQREFLDSYENYGKVCCFKGFNEDSFAFNTAADPSLFARQFELMSRLVSQTKLDLYGYATFTAPGDTRLIESMHNFVDRLQAIDKMLPLRVVPLQITAFTPTHGRMNVEHERALEIQEDAIAAWNSELATRFTDADRTLPIRDVSLRRH